MNDEDRAKRLQRSRRKSKDRAQGSPKEETLAKTRTPETPAKTENRATPSEESSSESVSATGKPSVKEVYEATHMYLPEDVKKRLKRAYQQASLDVEMELDEDVLEKNRHWYPLVLIAGLDALEDVDATEIWERAYELEERTHK